MICLLKSERSVLYAAQELEVSAPHFMVLILTRASFHTVPQRPYIFWSAGGVLSVSLVTPFATKLGENLKIEL